MSKADDALFYDMRPIVGGDVSIKSLFGLVGTDGSTVAKKKQGISEASLIDFSQYGCCGFKKRLACRAQLYSSVPL